MIQFLILISRARATSLDSNFSHSGIAMFWSLNFIAITGWNMCTGWHILIESQSNFQFFNLSIWPHPINPGNHLLSSRRDSRALQLYQMNIILDISYSMSTLIMVDLHRLLTHFIMFRLRDIILLMEEIRLTGYLYRLVVFPCIYKVLYIPGG